MTIESPLPPANGPAVSARSESRVAVVVLTWNGLDDTRRCLDSVLRNTRSEDAEIIVVDNGSTDGTVDYLKALPGIRSLFNAKNLGFVGGNNVALRLLEPGRDVVLLNNDTLIEDPDWLKKLRCTAYSGDDVGVVGCRIRRIEGGMLQHAGTYVPDHTFWGQQLGAGEKDVNQYNQDITVEGVVFACVYIRHDVIKAVGILDDAFFSYFEDTDYCLRAREAGFRTVVCGALTIGHLEHGSTAANNVSQSDMFLTSQKTFLAKWREKLEARYDSQVMMHTTFSRPVGYAMTARQIAVALDGEGLRVAYRYLYGQGTVFPVAEDPNASTGSYRVEVIRQRSEPEASVPRLIYGQADAFDSVSAKFRVGYTMLETTGIPAEWSAQCNRLDEVWVPSPFNEWTFRRSGVTAPIKVMPLGLIDTNYFNPQINAHRLPGLFTFLSVFEWGERKSPEALLRAFNRAFRATEPVVLICRFSNHDPGVDPEGIIRGLGLDPEGGRVVLSQNEPVPYYQMAQIYRSADCFVLPTRGEGWGMPILEAMACGIPVIASYWSAQQLFLSDANSYPLQVRLVPAEAKCPYYDGFKWADPDEDELCRLMRHVYDHKEEARAKGARAARDVAERWSLELSVARMAARLRTLAPERKTRSFARTGRGNPGLVPRIGIDVSRAVGPQVAGVGRFTADLVRGLSQREDGLDYLLFPGFGDFIHPEYRRGSNPLIDGVASNTTLYRGPLPAFCDEDHDVPGLALLYCTANSFRKAFASRSAMVVYDTTFLSHPEFHTRENIELCKRNFESAVKADCRFIAISDSSRSDFIKFYGVDSRRVDTIHCGIDLQFFRPASAIARESARQRYALPERYFLYVGSLEPRKNLATLLHAMARYNGPEKLVVVGASGWMNSAIHEQIRKAGDRVQLLGYAPQEDLPALYSGARAFVYPSVYEGFGLPIVEAMACGTPVVTTGNSSMKEISEGAAVLVEDPLDSRELARQLSRLSGDDYVHGAIAAAGVRRAAGFGIDRLADRHVTFFKSFIEENS